MSYRHSDHYSKRTRTSDAVHGIYEVVYFAGEPLTILEIVGALAEQGRFQSWCRSWGEENVEDGRWSVTAAEWSSWSDDERYRYALEKLVRPKVHYMTHKGYLTTVVTHQPVSDNGRFGPQTYSAGDPPPKWRYAQHTPGRMEQFLPDVERAKGDRHIRTMQLTDRARELLRKRRFTHAEVREFLVEFLDLRDTVGH